MTISLRNRYGSLSDEDLMERVCGGDTRAFSAIVDRHSNMAFSLAYRMCGKQATAEDIVQDAFLSVWRSSARFDRDRGNVRSWVLSAVHNRAIDTFRRQTAKDGRDVHDDALADQLAAPESTEREAEKHDEQRAIRDALDTIPGEQRRVIELAYFGGFSQTEIAEMLGLPTGTVKGRMRLGMAKLRIQLAGSIAAIS